MVTLSEIIILWWLFIASQFAFDFIGTNIMTKEIRNTKELGESSKLRAMRAKNVFACQRALCAYVVMCQHALCAYVVTCLCVLRAYVLTCLCVLRAYVLTCLRALRCLSSFLQIYITKNRQMKKPKGSVKQMLMQQLSTMLQYLCTYYYYY